MCVCVYVCICVSVYVHEYVCMCMCMCVCVCICVSFESIFLICDCLLVPVSCLLIVLWWSFGCLLIVLFACMLIGFSIDFSVCLRGLKACDVPMWTIHALLRLRRHSGDQYRKPLKHNCSCCLFVCTCVWAWPLCVFVEFQVVFWGSSCCLLWRDFAVVLDYLSTVWLSFDCVVALWVASDCILMVCWSFVLTLCEL